MTRRQTPEPDALFVEAVQRFSARYAEMVRQETWGLLSVAVTMEGGEMKRVEIAEKETMVAGK